MSDGKLENLNMAWGVLCVIAGWVASMIKTAFSVGKRDGSLATKKDLELYVPRHEFDSFKLDLKSDLTEIKDRQFAGETLNEKRHSQVIDLLVNGNRGGSK